MCVQAVSVIGGSSSPLSWLFVCLLCFMCFFFFKQKTAYEMRISDWSSDVCSSDLEPNGEITLVEAAEPLHPPLRVREQPRLHRIVLERLRQDTRDCCSSCRLQSSSGDHCQDHRSDLNRRRIGVVGSRVTGLTSDRLS